MMLMMSHSTIVHRGLLGLLVLLAAIGPSGGLVICRHAGGVTLAVANHHRCESPAERIAVREAPACGCGHAHRSRPETSHRPAPEREPGSAADRTPGDAPDRAFGACDDHCDDVAIAFEPLVMTGERVGIPADLHAAVPVIMHIPRVAQLRLGPAARRSEPPPTPARPDVYLL